MMQKFGFLLCPWRKDYLEQDGYEVIYYGKTLLRFKPATSCRRLLQHYSTHHRSRPTTNVVLKKTKYPDETKNICTSKPLKNKNFIKIFGEIFLNCHILSECVTFHRLLLFVTFWNIRKKRKKRKKVFSISFFFCRCKSLPKLPSHIFGEAIFFLQKRHFAEFAPKLMSLKNDDWRKMNHSWFINARFFDNVIGSLCCLSIRLAKSYELSFVNYVCLTGRFKA